MPLKVLISQSNAIVALDLQRSLQKLGYEVVAAAEDTSKTIKYAEVLKPDVLVIDIDLIKIMDGIDTAHKLQRKELLPVVFISAYNVELISAQLKMIKNFAIIPKPFDVKDIDTTIKEMISINSYS